ncbi:mannose-6-phosphate isomerase, class I [Lacisediminihabitans changchengi]|uniref:mannose-6-phosphate isomerase n=1 Tax=Lacisediminihabitans changchengi TaxID=2787634 RepID=A0A934W2Q5_9MICO|nr:mannose-6-phosphate isomerase, class I [Lacisediminihabitans changchengi]MBK4346429.1 mannose-6-phosphate isomerase, class I [Lacisediminihabitans changchengi]
MFVKIANTPRPYAWGSTSAIADLLGTTPSGEPEAELWLGAHPGSPSRIVDPAEAEGSATLLDWIAADPAKTLGGAAGAGQLPFLLKVLAASSALSLQAHPTPEQALEGFERENALGIPLDARNRNYKDAFAKPEMIFALSETFDALCGFRSLDETREIVHALLDADQRREDPQPQPLEDLLAALSTPSTGSADDALRTTFEWLLSNGAGVPTLVRLVSDIAPLASSGRFDREFATVGDLAREYPGDPGIVISLLLNRVTLSAGEALYLPAGNIHAYLQGLGVELMAASDNVLRGGLTPKYVDVPELLSVLDFRAVPVPYLHPSTPAPTVQVFQPDVPDFLLVRVTGDAGYRVDGPAIALCTAGAMTITGAVSSTSIARGESFFVTPEEGTLAFRGEGTVFLATTGE